MNRKINASITTKVNSKTLEILGIQTAWENSKKNKPMKAIANGKRANRSATWEAK